MIQFQFFPRSLGINKKISDIIECFRAVEELINSKNHNLKSDEVLHLVQPYLENIGYLVENGKSKDDKIDVPVLFGTNNNVDKYFYADALSSDGTIVIEVEAGRATENNQFLKDIFQACMMYNVEYLL